MIYFLGFFNQDLRQVCDFPHQKIDRHYIAEILLKVA